MDSKTTLIATLGGQPQKVTFLLDLLQARGENIQEVALVYISSYLRTQNALERLAEEFAGDLYAGYPCKLILHPVRSDRADLFDIRTPEEAEAARQSIHELLHRLKEDCRRIHLGLSGGRRLMSMGALAAAMQYLTPVDRIWHLNVPADVAEQTRTGGLMHISPEAGVHLLPVPFVPWVSYFPGLSNLLKRSPQEIAEASRGWLDEKNRSCCERVWNVLTPRQRDALQAFASGLSRRGVADRLGIAVTTVDNHRDNILTQCRLAWDEIGEEEFNTLFLQKYFGPFIEGRI
jgi:CRISPR-associated protein Csx14